MNEFMDGYKELLVHTYDLTEEEYAKFVKLFKQILDGDTPMGREMDKGGLIFHD